MGGGKADHQFPLLCSRSNLCTTVALLLVGMFVPYLIVMNAVFCVGTVARYAAGIMATKGTGAANSITLGHT